MPNRNSTVENPPTTPRRSPRLIILHQNNNNPITPKPKPKSKSKSKSKSRTPTVRVRKSPRLNHEVPSLRRSPRFSNEQKIDVKLIELPSRDSARKCREGKKKENNGVIDEVILVEVGGKRKSKRGGDGIVDGGDRIVSGGDGIVDGCDEIEDGLRKEEVEGGVKRKRKRVGGEIVEGWTKEQELALRTAYFTAKPSPHFWKNVSRLVPGKSQQDCFDRVHQDFHTPTQTQPKSRAKAINTSPLHQFSISASKLLKPAEKKVVKSNILKPKNYIAQKSIENLLQRHLKVNKDHEGDIFSVLEPNIDFSTNNNALQPSQALSTPKQQKENQGLLQNCTERSSSSSSHKKSLSRFSGSGVQDLASPPVLKKVKNKVQHEKYVNQLRYRELRRRAASTRTKISKVGEGNGIQKKDVVKAAKVALVSEARDAINKFQQSQVNIMDSTCSSDEEGNDEEFNDE